MPRIHYELRDVRALCELTRAKGFREAADTLAITPSALSRRIAKLEEAIGGLLVSRTTRSMALTPLGRRLVGRCEPLLNALDDGIEASARQARGIEGQLSVGTVSSVSYALLAPVVTTFRQRHPNLRILLKESNAFGIGEAVRNYEVDFGVSTLAISSREIDAEVVAVDPVVLVCNRESPLAKPRSLRWVDIRQQRLMGFKASSSIRQSIDGRLAKVGIELQWFDEVDTLSSLVSHLRTGQFVGVVPRLVASQLQELAVIPLTAPRIERKIVLLRRNDVEMNVAARSFWDDVRTRLGSALAKR